MYCYIWHVRAIPTYRVYRLCDINCSYFTCPAHTGSPGFIRICLGTRLVWLISLGTSGVYVHAAGASPPGAVQPRIQAGQPDQIRALWQLETGKNVCCHTSISLSSAWCCHGVRLNISNVYMYIIILCRNWDCGEEVLHSITFLYQRSKKPYRFGICYGILLLSPAVLFAG